MFKKLADDDFRALKVSADQRRREQGRSRIPSRIHSPGPELDDLNFRTGLDLFGTGLNSDQDLEINFDPLSDWENMNSLEGWSSLWEYDRGGGC